MAIVNVHEAKTHFSKIIRRSLNGEEIIIAKGGVPLVCIIPYVQEPLRRKGGQLKGLIEIPDNFDDPLPSEYLDAFYGKDDK